MDPVQRIPRYTLLWDGELNIVPVDLLLIA
jgi:hypothetical protein